MAVISITYNLQILYEAVVIPGPREVMQGRPRAVSLFFFTLSATRMRERRAAKPRDARNEGGSPRRERETARIARANEICVGPTTQKYDWLMREGLTTNCQQSKPLTS